MRRIPIPVFPWPMRLAAVVLVAGLIFYWSILAVPSPEPIVPSPTPSTESTPDTFTLPEWRHIVAYFTLGMTLCYALVTKRIPIRWKIIAVVSIAVLYGSTIEVIQAFHTHREFSFGDIQMNAIGAVASTGWFFVERYGRLIRIFEQMDAEIFHSTD